MKRVNVKKYAKGIRGSSIENLRKKTLRELWDRSGEVQRRLPKIRTWDDLARKENKAKAHKIDEGFAELGKISKVIYEKRHQ